MTSAALTRPYVLAEDLQPSPYAPDWPPASPGQDDEEAAGDPAAPAGDEDQDQAAPGGTPGDTPHNSRAVGRVPIAEEPTVIARAYAPRHTPEAVQLARCSGEVRRGLYRSDPAPALVQTWNPAAPLHRRPTRPGIVARLIGQVRRMLL